MFAKFSSLCDSSIYYWLEAAGVLGLKSQLGGIKLFFMPSSSLTP